MQAIIMAAGKGSRLGDLTKGNPKSFVEINGKKLIEYNLEILKELGVDKIVIVTGYREEAFGELTKDMPEVVLKYNPFYGMVNVLGSFYMGMEELTDDFIYLHADTLCAKSVFDELVKFEGDVNLPVEFKPCDEEAMKVRSENGQIVQITKEMPIDDAQGEFIGIASFKREMIPVVKAKAKEALKEEQFLAYFETVIQKMIDDKKYDIRMVDIQDAFWAEIDFLEDYEQAVERLKEKNYEL